MQHVDGLLWNALYESFSVHARALYEFLKNDKDTRNYRAREYVNEFDCDTTSMQALMDRMQQQVMHLGKRRTVDKGEIDINGIKQM